MQDDSSMQVEKLRNYISNYFSDSNNDKSIFYSMIRNSVLEKIITIFLFQYQTNNNEFSFTAFLNYIKEVFEKYDKNPNNLEPLEKQVKLFIEEIDKQTKNDRHQQNQKNHPLYIYSKIVESVRLVHKNHYQNNDFGIENVVKIEKLLQEHIDANFFVMKTEGRKIDTDFFNEQYVKSVTEKHEYNYSITSLFTVLEIMKKLETHNVQINDNETFIEDGFMTEKKLQVYERQLKKTTVSYSKVVNVIENFIYNGHLKKILNQMYSLEPIYNNYELEQKLCLSLFIIKKIIKDYSFYFSKMELENLFIELKKFKDFPLPIGALGMELFEILINELYFQGVTITNQLRSLFMFDSVDHSVKNLFVKHFNPVYTVYYEDDSKQDISKILQYIGKNFDIYMEGKISNEESKPTNLSSREFLIKLFITIVRNSNFPINNSILEFIVKRFYMHKKVEYKNNNNNNNNDEDKEDKEDRKKQDNTFTSIKKIMRIIDVGLDKNYEEFMEDIQYIAEPLISLNETYMMGGTNITTQPITEFRSYLNCYFENEQKVIPEIDYNINNTQMFNVYQTFLKSFTNLFNYYFSHLDDQELDTEEVLTSKFKKRNNLFKNFKLKLLIFEDKKTLSHLLDQLAILDKSKDIIENSKDWSFWSKFIKKSHDFNIPILIYIIPNIDNFDEIYPKTADKSRPYLSEYIANNDYIYQTLVYNPWLCKKDFITSQLVEPKPYSNEKHDFKCAEDTDFHSMFIDPLYLYTSEANKLLNLYLFKIINSNNTMEKYFWRCIEIEFFPQSKEISEKKKKIENNFSITVEITMWCVDSIGLEYKDNKFSMKITNPIELRIFNVFAKKDSPLHYNNTNNNSWLEVFILGKLLFYYFMYICILN